tara:strand:- start:2965 stop:3339 length:375 start_codon:yes stop_codon:yes gene_type:complete
MKKSQRNKLTDTQYAVAREGATEAPFSGKYNDEKRAGIYICTSCNHKLFDSKKKYDSGSGWPAFYAPFEESSIINTEDCTHGMIRTEVKCKECDAHLGHVFPDGPEPTGLRYCINSIVLKFIED